ncbi:MAG: hypothetical protein P8Y81_10940, partial [Ignavibacteriaceae bacterium]
MLRKFNPLLLCFLAISFVSINFSKTSDNQLMDTTNTGVTNENPFFTVSKLPFQAPQFDKIKDSEYKPAFVEGMKQQLEEIEKIADNP